MSQKPAYEELERKVRRLEKENAALKQTEERLHLLSSITENMSDSVVAANANFEITYLNKKAGELFGCRLDELRGNHRTSLMRHQPPMRFKPGCMKRCLQEKCIWART